jgi:ATP-dependent Clp endopeptidase proteolytic subunit ClpP
METQMEQMMSEPTPPKFQRFVMRATGEADVYIYEDIGKGWDGSGLTAKAFAKDFDVLMKKSPSAIAIHLNSNGGDVNEGLAIANTIGRAKDRTTVYVEGFAASIASVIAIAGQKTVMANNALFMIHNPWGIVMGDEHAMEKQAKALGTIKQSLITAYVTKTGKSEAEISAAMDEETWFTANESKEYGLADEVQGDVMQYNQVTRDSWRTWNSIRNQVKTEAPPVASASTLDEHEEVSAMADPKTEGPKPATIGELKAACVGASPEFLCAQLEAEATVDVAMRAYQKMQAEALAAKDAEIEVLKKKTEKAAKTEPVIPGVAPVTETVQASSESLDVEARWKAAVKEQCDAGLSKKQAIMTVVRENSDLHKAYLAAYNARNGREA